MFKIVLVISVLFLLGGYNNDDSTTVRPEYTGATCDYFAMLDQVDDGWQSFVLVTLKRNLIGINRSGLVVAVHSVVYADKFIDFNTTFD